MQFGHLNALELAHWIRSSLTKNTLTPKELVGSERRAHFRMPLRVSAALRRGDDNFRTISAITQDISSGGCYCISPEVLMKGENLECEVVIASAVHAKPELRLSLHVCVRRVEKLSEEADRYGIALQIQSYRVMRKPAAAVVTSWLGGTLMTAIN